jgi:hypothetical protein
LLATVKEGVDWLEVVIVEAFAVGPAAVAQVVWEAHWGPFIIHRWGVVPDEGFNGDAGGKEAG